MTAGASFGDVRSALAERLATISGLKTYEHVPEALAQLPAAVIEGFEDCVQDSMGNGGWQWTVLITVYASRASVRSGQIALDALASPNSDGGVWRALQTKPVGGDGLDAVSITRLRDYGEYDASGRLLGFQILADVWA